MSGSELEGLTIEVGATIEDAAHALNAYSRGIVLVVDVDGRLVDTITDGDIRRAVLAGIPLESDVSELQQQKQGGAYRRPSVAPPGLDASEYLRIMRRQQVKHLPIIDDHERVTDLVRQQDLTSEPDEQSIRAVVMAGGFGTRLHPLTEETPKPMLRVGGKPLLERIVGQLQQAGIHQVCVSTHFAAEKIKRHFGDGEGFGVDITYLDENEPLGTAGALRQLDHPETPVLVINGDILTDVDFRAMASFHEEHGSDLTVAVRQYDLQVPYGVLECDGATVRRFREKPCYEFFVNAGIYMLGAGALDFVPSEDRVDMSEVIDRMLAAGRHVISFPVMEYWLDIGAPVDFERAQHDIQQGRVSS